MDRETLLAHLAGTHGTGNVEAMSTKQLRVFHRSLHTPVMRGPVWHSHPPDELA